MQAGAFTPKVFIFRGGGNSVAWVGSANFTSGGFEMNDEAVFETSDTESVQNWFDNLWAHTDPLDAAAIDAYAKSRKNNPPPPAPRPPNTLDLNPLQLLEGVTDWQSYVAALEQCDGWWSNRHSFSVLGERSSWRETAEVLHDVVAQPDWDKLGQYDRFRLLGLGGWGLFGGHETRCPSTRYSAPTWKRFKTSCSVSSPPRTTLSPQLAFDSYSALRDIDGIGPGIATRFLTLARPDRFVSVNGESTAGLAASFGLPPHHPWQPAQLRPSSHHHLRAGLVQGSGPPGNARERAIWRIRAALLDSFVYGTEAAG